MVEAIFQAYRVNLCSVVRYVGWLDKSVSRKERQKAENEKIFSNDWIILK